LAASISRTLDIGSDTEANFIANQVVDRRFAQNPARGLAMTVFGNPELSLVCARFPAREGEQ